MTENELRKAVVAQATAWLGCNEADKQQKPMYDEDKRHSRLLEED